MKTKKEEYARLGVTIPQQLLDDLDKYCRSILTGNPKIRSAIVRQAIAEFLARKKKNGGWNKEVVE